MVKKVVLSNRAVAAMRVEIDDHPVDETGGIFLGYRKGNVWYVMEMIDPGIECIFSPANFEYDGRYLNHLMNKINRLYSAPLDILGLWHRHPGSFDSFSLPDDETNEKFAKNNSEGIISGILNIDPEIRFTLYHVSLPLNYKMVKCIAGDNHIPADLFKYKDVDSSAKKENKCEKNDVNGKLRVDNEKEERNSEFLLKDIMENYLLEEKPVTIYKVKKDITSNKKEKNIDHIIEQINEDLEFLKDEGFTVKLKADVNGCIAMEEYSDMDKETVDSVVWSKHGNKTYIKFQNRSYRYFPGMIKEACDYFKMRSIEDGD